MKYPRLASAFTLVALFFGIGCVEENTFVDEQPPPGSGGFNPGGPSTSRGYGYGASNGQGGSGGGGAPPLMCDDEFKRCAHELTYSGEASSVEVRGDFKPDGWTNGVPMTLEGNTWKALVDVPWDAPVQYKLVLDGTNWINDPANPVTIDDGFGGLNSLLDGITCGEDFTCAPPLLGDFDWRDAVLYFVFVDRFFDGDPSNNGSPVPNVPTAANFQGGDFAGVTQKIEEGYFTDLGINALWLSVPMDNTEASGPGDDGQNYSAYHGYWPQDLDATESRFGTLEELQALVAAAHAKDIKVIVDYAMNHVHETSPVYTQHPDWFWPLDNGGQYCVCGAGCSWDGAQGKRCWFRDYLPDFNFTNAAARDFSVSNAIEWIEKTNIDGFRLDAVKHIEDSWLLDLRSRVKSEIESVTQQHFYMVGETFTGDKATIAYYVNPSTMLDGQFDFPLRASIVSTMLIRNGSMADLESFLDQNDGYYGSGIMSTFVGNHDVPRSIHFATDTPLWSDPWAGGKEIAWNNQPGVVGGMSAYERFATAFTLIYTLPGVPLVYYGDEIGLPGAGDPDNRRFMQWSGYSAGQSFLKAHLVKLAEVRAAHPALRRGTRTTLSVQNDTFAYRMQDGADVVIVAINRGNAQANVGGIPDGTYVDGLDGSSHQGGSVTVPARSARVLSPM
jgi:glycosidase